MYEEGKGRDGSRGMKGHTEGERRAGDIKKEQGGKEGKKFAGTMSSCILHTCYSSF